jgi:RimJ/RimL family protein N-acetyltransferase
VPIDKPFLLDLPEKWVGERVVLRRWRDADAQPIYETVMASQEHLAPWMPWAKQYQSVDDAYQFIRGQSGHWSFQKRIGTGIWRREDGALLGGLGVTVRHWGLPAFEIGYWIGQMYEGRGYMSESVRVMTTYLFEVLQAQRVAIRCDARNLRSKAVPERLGYTFEGSMRHYDLGTDGTIRDMLIYAMIPDDYARARAAWGKA